MFRGTFSGTSTLNMPRKNTHAASQPAITAAVVCENVKNTKQYRDTTAVNTSACTFRRRSPSLIIPRKPKSSCTSSPGSQSATGTVTACRDDEEYPHSPAANRASVRYGTAVPDRFSTRASSPASGRLSPSP